jgi:glycosyltransferase involved in cell wall biosynthesis
LNIELETLNSPPLRRDNRTAENPFFSVCIPQHNRTSFLIEVCKSLAAQTFKDFEVCISDDCSTDDREGELLAYLEQSGLSFVYQRQEKNLRYDGNLRASIALSCGQYCFLLGNDDALATPEVFQQIHDEIVNYGIVGVAVTNFEDYATGQPTRRVKETKLQGSGPVMAVNNYRKVSFVSGVILNGAAVRATPTDKWDGSEMYQMYQMSRILGQGGSLLDIDLIATRKDIQLPGEEVDTFAKKPRIWPCPIIERFVTFHLLGRLVVDGFSPFVEAATRQRLAEKVLQQVLTLIYPYWIFQYRHVQSWKYAAGLCLGMRPRHIMQGIELNRLRKIRLTLLYLISTVLALCLPLAVFDTIFPRVQAFAQSSWAKKILGARAG